MKKLVGLLAALIAAVPIVALEAYSSIQTYVFRDRGDAIMLRLTSAPGGMLQGSLTAVFVQPDGEMNTVSRNVTGSQNDGAMNLTMQAFLGATVMSGSTTANGLHLVIFANGKAQDLNFVKGSEADFVGAEAAVRTQASAVIQSNQRADAIQKLSTKRHDDQQRIDTFVAELNSKTASDDKNTAKLFSSTIQGFEITAQRGAAMTAHERQLSANSQNSFEISQIEFQRDLNATNAKKMHDQITQLQLASDISDNQFITSFQTFSGLCNSGEGLNCGELPAAYRNYRDALSNMRNAIRSADASYDKSQSAF